MKESFRRFLSCVGQTTITLVSQFLLQHHWCHIMPVLLVTTHHTALKVTCQSNTNTAAPLLEKSNLIFNVSPRRYMLSTVCLRLFSREQRRAGLLCTLVELSTLQSSGETGQSSYLGQADAAVVYFFYLWNILSKSRNTTASFRISRKLFVTSSVICLLNILCVWWLMET